MARYFIEVSYYGKNYAGFQIQQNANTIQAEVEKALSIFFKTDFALTGSSRTDAGVHAIANYFHFDLISLDIANEEQSLQESLYNLNAILPPDIVIKRIFRVCDTAHCRFDVKSRLYRYHIYRQKNPFLADRAFYFPYRIHPELLQEAASVLLSYSDFTSFSKKHTQVKTFICNLIQSHWQFLPDEFIYTVEGNRFLRGMVRGLVGTMLKVGTGKMTINEFKAVIETKDISGADFSVPPQGLFLTEVKF